MLSCFFGIFMSDFCFDDRTEINHLLVVILGGKNGDIMCGLIWFSELRVFLQMFFLQRFLRKVEG